MSPTQRSLKRLRDDGWTAQVVEYWNHYARRRIDLFGCIDIVAVRVGETLGVQATTGANGAARVAKAQESADLRIWLAAGNRFEVWAWWKPAHERSYEPRIVALRLGDDGIKRGFDLAGTPKERDRKVADPNNGE